MSRESRRVPADAVSFRSRAGLRLTSALAVPIVGLGLGACTTESAPQEAPVSPNSSLITPAPETGATLVPTPEAAPQLLPELQTTKETREITDPATLREHIAFMQATLRTAIVDPSEGFNNDPEFWDRFGSVQDTPDDQLNTRFRVYVESENDASTGALENWHYRYLYREQPVNPNDVAKPSADLYMGIYHTPGSSNVSISTTTHMSADGSFSGYAQNVPTADYSTLLTNAARIVGVPGREFVPTLDSEGKVTLSADLGPDRNNLTARVHEGGSVQLNMYGALGTELTAGIPDDTISTVSMDNNAHLAGTITTGHQDAAYKRQLLGAITDSAFAEELSYGIDLDAASDVVYDAHTASSPEQFEEIEAAVDAIPNPDARQKAEVGVDHEQADQAVDAADIAYRPEDFAEARVIANLIESPELRAEANDLINEAERLDLAGDYSDAFDDARYALSDRADDVRYALSDEARDYNFDIYDRTHPVDY